MIAATLAESLHPLAADGPGRGGDTRGGDHARAAELVSFAGSAGLSAVAVWLVWLILAMVLWTAETFTGTAALGLLGAAALGTAGVAAIGLAVPLQLLVFAVLATGALAVLRRTARQVLRPRLVRFGIDALTGQTAYAVTEVTGRSGTVRISREEWSARCLDDALVIPAGAAVDVIRIDGATAVVYPQE